MPYYCRRETEMPQYITSFKKLILTFGLWDLFAHWFASSCFFLFQHIFIGFIATHKIATQQRRKKTMKEKTVKDMFHSLQVHHSAFLPSILQYVKYIQEYCQVYFSFNARPSHHHPSYVIMLHSVMHATLQKHVQHNLSLTNRA